METTIKHGDYVSNGIRSGIVNFQKGKDTDVYVGGRLYRSVMAETKLETLTDCNFQLIHKRSK